MIGELKRNTYFILFLKEMKNDWLIKKEYVIQP